MFKQRARPRRWIGIGLSTFVVGFVSILGVYHFAFAVDQRDVNRYRRIFRETPVQSLPHAVETDFNVRFVPAMAAQALIKGIDTKVPISRSPDAFTSPDGYIFALEDMRVAYGRSFVDPRERRPADALKSISAFAGALRTRNIHLIVVPIPAKTSIHPEQADPQSPAPDSPLVNKGHHAWLDQLRGEGVEVCDLTDMLWANRGTGPLFYLPDTHWTQHAMHLAARSLAPRLDQLVDARTERQAFSLRPLAYVMSGDLAFHAPESVQPIHERLMCLYGERGPLHFGDSAPVLVLGDSYAEQFETEGGGFAQLLAYETRLPVQSAAVRGIRASQMLGPSVAQNPRLLENKQVVVLVFSIRKLQVNDWIPAPPGPG
jgi:hypothetical protein